MTKSVQWGFMPRTELRLPLTLHPHDAHSTILVIDAGEKNDSRSFLSPVSVTGVVGRQRVVVNSDSQWTTELVAVEPADAFRITMSVGRSAEVRVGEPFVISLKIFNLSFQSRDLMLVVANEDERKARDHNLKEKAVNSGVVSESHGYTFGVMGIAPEDDGTARLFRDHDLLAVDGGLVLGKVLGQHAVDANLRFVPLAEGSLCFPKWKLYDTATGTWYSCNHNLSVVARK